MNYNWTLKDTTFTKDKGKVFSCFSCGGGSTMGYKLAGFDVIGCNEIDPKMMEVYKENHNPKYSFLESITTFKEREDLPQELFNLDILDGSPPCSSFSMAGNREKDWGKEKKFREGQQEQVLDTLFFDFIDLAKRLQPKVVIAENVKGLLQGDAVKYVDKILRAFDDAGYSVDYKLLDASKMGVPQRRERVFFYAIRKDLDFETTDLFGERPYLDLEFNEKPIPFKEVYKQGIYDSKHSKEGKIYEWWKIRKPSDNSFGDCSERYNGKGSCFSVVFFHKNKVAPTLTRRDRTILYDEFRGVNNIEASLVSSFPLDYNYLKSNPTYIMGMSVPPLMTAKIAQRVKEAWL
jgi:DNA (cytosine-5)-methyltransferase 1